MATTISPLATILESAIEKQRICTVCKKSKPESEWGQSGRCRECTNAAALACYHRHPENRPYQAAVNAIRYRQAAKEPKTLARHHVEAIAKKLLALTPDEREAVLELVRGATR